MEGLRQHIRKLQILENEASKKAGMRFLLLFDERKLLGKDKRKFIKKYTETLIQDILPEIIKSAKMGREFNKRITK